MNYQALFLVLAALFVAGSLPATAQDTAKADSPAEKISPSIVAEALWDGRKIVPFKALDFPIMVPAEGANEIVGDDEYILGVTYHGESRAYPTRFAWFHHVINDKIGDTNYAVTYCSVCNTGIAYDRNLDGKPVLIDFYGLYNAVVALAERDTQTAMLQVTGEFVKGPLTGKKLKPLPMIDTTWGRWKQLHPKTLVMSPPVEFAKFYRPKGLAEPRGYDKFPLPFFEQSLVQTDTRLPRFDKVLGVAFSVNRAGKEATVRRAYPVKSLQEANGVLNDMVEGRAVVAFLDLETVTAAAFLGSLDKKVMTFEARKTPEGPFAIYDKETGTRWNIEGLGVEGPLKDRSLVRIENHLSQWYGWSAYYPETTIFGKTEAPQPEILKKGSESK